MKPALLAARLLADPAQADQLDGSGWSAVVRAGRAERVIASLILRLGAAGVAVPPRIAEITADDLAIAAYDQLRAHWEIDRARHALTGLGAPVVLLKGSAYLHAGLPPAMGRRIGDLDILVPRAALGDAESLLRRHGWQSVKDDPYDDRYYREWMHELPPLVHQERGGVIDVHHTILPLTARLRPDAAALVGNAVRLPDGLHVLSPAEMLLHAATHCAYDGDFEGGLRNLWDIHQLYGHFAGDAAFGTVLEAAAHQHGLTAPLARALRLSRRLFGTVVPSALLGRPDLVDTLALARIAGVDRHGDRRETLGDRLLYMRGHWLRMPPAMLAGHLLRKWRARRAGPAG